MRPFDAEGRNYCRPFGARFGAGSLDRLLECMVGLDFGDKYWEDTGDGRVVEERISDLKNLGEGS